MLGYESAVKKGGYKLMDLWLVGLVSVVAVVAAYIIVSILYEAFYSEPIVEVRSWYDPGYFVEGQRIVD
jgi:hypothetical protein